MCRRPPPVGLHCRQRGTSRSQLARFSSSADQITHGRASQIPNSVVPSIYCDCACLQPSPGAHRCERPGGSHFLLGRRRRERRAGKRPARLPLHAAAGGAGAAADDAAPVTGSPKVRSSRSLYPPSAASRREFSASSLLSLINIAQTDTLVRSLLQAPAARTVRVRRRRCRLRRRADERGDRPRRLQLGGVAVPHVAGGCAPDGPRPGLPGGRAAPGGRGAGREGAREEQDAAVRRARRSQARKSYSYMQANATVAACGCWPAWCCLLG